MSDGVMETTCTRCYHKEVCMHKQDFLDINKAVLDATVHKHYENSNGSCVTMKRVTDFECVGEIRVFCRYFTDY